MGTSSIIDAIVTVDYEEINGSPTEGYSKEGAFEATRTLQCDWEDRTLLAQQLLGNVSGSGTDVTITRGHVYPGNPFAYAESISGIQGVDRMAPEPSDTKVAEYGKAQLQVKYTQPKECSNLYPNADIYSEDFKDTCEFLTRGNQAKFYLNSVSDANLIIPPSGGFPDLQFGGEWQITRKKLGSIPFQFWLYQGRVNADQCGSTWAGNKIFDKGTLLFLPGEYYRETLANGGLTWTIKLKLAYKPIGWNNFFVTKQATREVVKTDYLMGDSNVIKDASGSTYAPYSSDNMNDFLTSLVV